MNRVTRKLELAGSLLAEGNLREAVLIVASKAWGNKTALGLRRDLMIPFDAPAAAVPISIRLLRNDDIPWLLGTDASGLTIAARRERIIRLHTVKAGFSSCYVAVFDDDRPCFMQWLIGPDENDRLKACFGGQFPTLEPDEALLEGAFTLEAHRGKGIMSCAKAQIAEKASELGARWVISFVGRDNIPSLKGSKRSGFVPYQLREETWRLFRRQTSVTSLPAGTPYPFDVTETTAVPQPAISTR